MNYWLLSQNLLSENYTKNLLEAKKDEDFNLYIWNWLYNQDKIKTIEDINLKNLDNPSKIDWRYSLIQFKDEMKVWDIVTVIQNKKQIYGIWKIKWNIKINKHNEIDPIINWPDEMIFSRKIEWIYKAEWWFFNLPEENKINSFRRTLSKLKEIEYKKLEFFLETNKDKIITKDEDKNETIFFKKEEKNEELKNNEKIKWSKIYSNLIWLVFIIFSWFIILQKLDNLELNHLFISGILLIVWLLFMEKWEIIKEIFWLWKNK